MSKRATGSILSAELVADLGTSNTSYAGATVGANALIVDSKHGANEEDVSKREMRGHRLSKHKKTRMVDVSINPNAETKRDKALRKAREKKEKELKRKDVLKSLAQHQLTKSDMEALSKSKKGIKREWSNGSEGEEESMDNEVSQANELPAAKVAKVQPIPIVPEEKEKKEEERLIDPIPMAPKPVALPWVSERFSSIKATLEAHHIAKSSIMRLDAALHTVTNDAQLQEMLVLESKRAWWPPAVLPLVSVVSASSADATMNSSVDSAANSSQAAQKEASRSTNPNALLPSSNPSTAKYVRPQQIALDTLLPKDQRSRAEKAKDVLPSVSSSLPITSIEGDLLDALDSPNPILIVAPPGSGKSTHVPLLLSGRYSKIVITQPRRLAAISLASYTDSGYIVRHETHKPDCNRIYVTDGTLLAMDKFNDFDVIILDEIHERSISTDLLLRVLASEFRGRLIMMSATPHIDSYISSLYPSLVTLSVALPSAFKLDLRYLKDTPANLMAMEDAAVSNILSTQAPNHKHTLVFLPGRQSMERVSARLTSPTFEVLMLHSGVPLKEQQIVYTIPPVGKRRIVLATSIAETSLTIPHITLVIDSGYTRRRRWSASRNSYLWTTERTSQAAAAQRAGRANRTANGACVRLYSVHVFGQLMPHDPPEMSVCGTIDRALLYLVSKGLFGTLSGDSEFSDSMQTLEGQSLVTATKSGYQLSVYGSRVLQLPMDVALAKLLVLSAAFGVRDYAVLLAAVLDTLCGGTTIVDIDLNVNKDKDGFRNAPIRYMKIVAAALLKKSTSVFCTQIGKLCRQYARLLGIASWSINQLAPPTALQLQSLEYLLFLVYPNNLTVEENQVIHYITRDTFEGGRSEYRHCTLLPLEWLSVSHLVSVSSYLSSPPPAYDARSDRVLASYVLTWRATGDSLGIVRLPMRETLDRACFLARALLDSSMTAGLPGDQWGQLKQHLTQNPIILTRSLGSMGNMSTRGVVREILRANCSSSREILKRILERREGVEPWLKNEVSEWCDERGRQTVSNAWPLVASDKANELVKDDAQWEAFCSQRKGSDGPVMLPRMQSRPQQSEVQVSSNVDDYEWRIIGSDDEGDE